MTGFRTQPNSRMQLAQRATAVVDTGTTLMYFPPRLVAAFYSTIPQAREATDISAGSWVFPCNTTVSVAIEINGVMMEVGLYFPIAAEFVVSLTPLPIDVFEGLYSRKSEER
jgi:hypothetical protein